MNEPVHEILVDNAHAQTPPLNANAGVSSGIKVLNCDLSLHLHPYFVYASSERSGESAHMRRLARVFAVRQCDKYQTSVLALLCMFHVRTLLD